MATVFPRQASCGTALLPLPLCLCMSGLWLLFNGFAESAGHGVVLMKSWAGQPMACTGLVRWGEGSLVLDGDLFSAPGLGEQLCCDWLGDLGKGLSSPGPAVQAGANPGAGQGRTRIRHPPGDPQKSHSKKGGYAGCVGSSAWARVQIETLLGVQLCSQGLNLPA